MPFFSKSKKPDKKTPSRNGMHSTNAGGMSNGGPQPNEEPATFEPLPVPVPAAANQVGTPATTQSKPSNQQTPVVPPAGKAGVYGNAAPPKPPDTKAKQGPLVFHTQLAHGSPTGKISGFTSVKELYQKIGDEFNLPEKQILFCTLNSFKVDMGNLLGGQIGLDDLIFAHVKGDRRDFTVLKSEPALGLTITDNGDGFAFIKRIKEKSAMDNIVDVGDHIDSINGKSVVGSRHFEVARMLKELPVGQQFTMTIVQPRRAFDQIAPRSKGASQATAASENNVKTGKATLRLRSTGPATLQAVPTAFETQAAQKVDDLLESYMGIRDEELAGTMVDLYKGKQDFSAFVEAVSAALSDFGFPEDTIFDIWGAIGDAKAGRL